MTRSDKLSATGANSAPGAKQQGVTGVTGITSCLCQCFSSGCVSLSCLGCDERIAVTLFLLSTPVSHRRCYVLLPQFGPIHFDALYPSTIRITVR